jgi:hypothetical protein
MCGYVWRCVEMCGDVDMCGDVEMWRCVEMCGDVWRCVEMCGDVWRCVVVLCSAVSVHHVRGEVLFVRYPSVQLLVTICAVLCQFLSLFLVVFHNALRER